MWQYRHTYELYHHGIKGMKWGVRRTKEELRYDRYSISATLNRNLKNVKTPNGVKVQKISLHALERIEKQPDRRVTARDITNALEKPLHIGEIRLDKLGQRSIRYIGKNATTNVNPDNGVITTIWKTGHREIKKYSKKGR